MKCSIISLAFMAAAAYGADIEICAYKENDCEKKIDCFMAPMGVCKEFPKPISGDIVMYEAKMEGENVVFDLFVGAKNCDSKPDVDLPTWKIPLKGCFAPKVGDIILPTSFTAGAAAAAAAEASAAAASASASAVGAEEKKKGASSVMAPSVMVSLMAAFVGMML